MALRMVRIRRIRKECDTTMTWSPEKIMVDYEGPIEAVVVKQTGDMQWVQGRSKPSQLLVVPESLCNPKP